MKRGLIIIFIVSSFMAAHPVFSRAGAVIVEKAGADQQKTEGTSIIKKGPVSKLNEKGASAGKGAASSTPKLRPAASSVPGHTTVPGQTTHPTMQVPERMRSLGQKPPATPKKKPAVRSIAFFAPKLEVKELSGDFEKWSKSIVRNWPEPLTFRWLTNTMNAEKARWEIREGARLRSKGVLATVPQPGHWQLFTLNYFNFRQFPKGKHTYTVRVILLDDKSKQIGQPSNPVTITFQPAPEVKQKITLDEIEILNIKIPPGAANNTITGPAYSENITDDNSVEITFKYNLITRDAAEIRYGFISGQKYIPQFTGFYATVEKGLGHRKLRGTVKCKRDDQQEVLVTKIAYRLADTKNVNNTLVAKTKILASPIPFRCPKTPPPDDISITDIKPSSSTRRKGAAIIIHGPKQGEPLNDSNSIKITYDYQLYSHPYGEIRQWALGPGGKVASGNYWTWSPIHKKGNGTAANRLTIRCLGNNQADTHISKINYKLFYKGTDNKLKTLIEKVRPVNYIFTCKEKRAMPLK